MGTPHPRVECRQPLTRAGHGSTLLKGMSLAPGPCVLAELVQREQGRGVRAGHTLQPQPPQPEHCVLLGTALGLGEEEMHTIHSDPCGAVALPAPSRPRAGCWWPWDALSSAPRYQALLGPGPASSML